MEPVVIDLEEMDPEIKELYQKKLKEHQQLLSSMMLEKDQLKEYEISKGNGQSYQEKVDYYYQNLIEYFKNGCEVDLRGNYQQKFTPDYQDNTLEFYPKSVVVYGVDFMSTQRVVKYFRYFNPEIQWIDDSSCKIIFETPQIVKEMFEQFKVNTQMGEQGINNKEWYLIKPYLQFGIEKRLQARIATNKDVPKDREQQNVKFKYFAYEVLKKRHQQKVKQQMLKNAPRVDRIQRRPRRPFDRNFNNNYNQNRNYNRDYNRDDKFNNRHKRIHKQRSLNYSFIRNNQSQQQQDNHNYSFQRGQVDESMFQQNLNISRANYSFARDVHIKQQSQRVQQNHSFRKQNIDESIRDLEQNLQNLSFAKNKNNTVIVIDDD